MKLKTYKVQLQALTPIHMGTGESYEMFDYIITAENPKSNHPKYTMHRMNVMEAIKELDILSPIDKIKMRQTDGLEYLQNKIFNNTLELLNTSQPIISIPISQDIYNEYRTYNSTQDKQALNSWNIFRIAYNGTDDQPYIPGSGVKGAIKTAVFSCKNRGQSHGRWYQMDSTKKLLGGSFKNDPFRHIKIADIHPNENTQTHIQYIHRVNSRYLQEINYDHNEPIKGKLTVRAEVIMPDMGTLYNGTINISDMNKTIKDPHKITIKQIIQHCNDFYVPKLQHHIKILKNNKRLPNAMTDMANQLQHILDTLNPDSCIINIGKYGGAVLKTMDGTRSILSRGQRGEPNKNLPEPKTMLVTGENKKFEECQSLLPLGWAVLTILP